MREQRECILAGSRRGGRRPKKVPPDAHGAPAPKLEPSTDSADVHDGTPAPNGHDDDRGREDLSPSWRSAWSRTPREGAQPYKPPIGTSNLTTQSAVDTKIAVADIQNPSDALEILAQVAGDAQVDRSHSVTSTSSGVDQRSATSPDRTRDRDAMLSNFPPLSTGALTVPMIHSLFARYHILGPRTEDPIG